MNLADRFNSSDFSRWLNSRRGRVFRFSAGIFFLLLAVVFWNSWLGIFSLVWFIFPLSAGAFDVCYISAVLGGPFRGDEIRERYRTNNHQ